MEPTQGTGSHHLQTPRGRTKVRKCWKLLLLKLFISKISYQCNRPHSLPQQRGHCVYTAVTGYEPGPPRALCWTPGEMPFTCRCEKSCIFSRGIWMSSLHWQNEFNFLPFFFSLIFLFPWVQGAHSYLGSPKTIMKDLRILFPPDVPFLLDPSLLWSWLTGFYLTTLYVCL